MRVTVIIDPAFSCPAPAQVTEAEHASAAEPAAQHPALRSLLANLDGAGSPFSVFGCRIWNAQEEGATPSFVFASRFAIVLQREAANSATKPFIGVAHKLAELLHQEADFLSAEMLICRVAGSEERSSYCLQLSLQASGSSPSQAQMRWGLAIARLQQALLFVARELTREGTRE